MNIFSMTGEVLLNDHNINNQLTAIDRRASGTSKSMSESFAGIGKAFAVVGAAAVGVGVGLFKLAESASDLTEANNVVESTFKKSGKAIEKWTETTAKSAGIGKTNATQWVGFMGAMLKSSGVSEKASSGMSKSLVQLTGDMSSFYNIDTKDMWEKLRSGISGETEPLKAIGINMSETNLKAYALAEGMKKPYAAMSQGEKTTLRYNYLMKVTKDAQGDFAKTLSTSFANQIRVAQLNLTTLGQKIGTVVLPAFNKAVQWFNGNMPKIQEAITSVFDIVVPVFKNVGKVIGEMMGFFNGLSEGTKKTILTFALMALAAIPLFKAFATIKTIVSGVGLVIGALSWPIVAVIAAIALLTVAFTNNWFGIRTKTMEFISFIKPYIIDAFNAVVGWFKLHWPEIKKVFELTVQGIVLAYNIYIKPVLTIMIAALSAVVNWVKANWPLIQKTIATVLNMVKSNVTSILNFIKAFWHTWGQTIKDYTSTIFNIIKTVISTVMKVVGNLIKAAMQLITGNWKGAWKSIVQAVKDLFGGVAKIVGTMLTGIGKLFINFAKVAVGYGKDMIQGIIDGIKSKANDIKNGAMDIVNMVITKFKEGFGIHSPSTETAFIGKHLITGLIKGMSGGNLKSFTNNMIKNLKKSFSNGSGAISETFQKMLGGSNGILEGASGLFSKLGFGGGSGGAPGNVSQMIQQAMAITGTNPMFLKGLETIAMKESGGNQNAINLWDSNFLAGHPSVGLFQTIQSTFDQFKLPGHNNMRNGVDSAIAAIRYMNSRYHGIQNNPGLRNMAGGGGYVGYKVGSRYIPTDMIAQVHQGEMIVPKSENPYANSGGRISPNKGDVYITLNSPTALSPSETARQAKLQLQELGFGF